jgi:ferredoxin-thioredoxin reductase catalytic chain
VDAEEIDKLYERLDREAVEGGYNLNPDREFTRALVEGLAVNADRYGYMACPCRRAQGERQADLDIICPCDYRDADLDEYDACYCGLYVSRDIVEGRKELGAVPERRPPRPEDRPQYRERTERRAPGLAVWHCRVCGYLCARETPPAICPICKAAKDRFEPFSFAA